VAAVVGAFGVGLLTMAVAITADGEGVGRHRPALDALRDRVARAADADTRDFEAVMSAYRMPAEDDTERDARTKAIEQASIPATEGPLDLAAALLDALTLSHELEPGVKQNVVSDVLAGRDVIAGAARAALRTADINLAQLERLSSPAAPGLRARRDELAQSVEEAA
jgi:formiminotetrahydrofolate cyclodeaminase